LPSATPTVIETVPAPAPEATDTRSQPSSRRLDTRDVISIDSVQTTEDPSSAVATEIGQVTDISGSVRAISTRDQQRILTVNDSIYLGDAILSADRSSASLRMVDNAIFHLRDNSRILFEHYNFEPQAQKGRSVMTLLKGGFRAISGLLGKKDPGAVTINTAVATIGIRGTDYGLRVCDNGSCDGEDSQVQLGDGLYAGVLDGAIALNNNTGEKIANKGEFYYIEGPNVAPVAAHAAAPMLFSPDELDELEEPLPDAKPLGFWGWLKRWIFG